MASLRLVIVGLMILGTGCNQNRIARLEKDNKELHAQLDKQKQFTDLDTQGKCSEAANKYFREEFVADKSTTVLDHYNHFNKEMGKCFALVEWHYSDVDSKTGSWFLVIKIVDVYERNVYADFSQYTDIRFSPTPSSEDRVLVCEVDDVKCSDMEHFHRMSAHFMSQ